MKKLIIFSFVSFLIGGTIGYVIPSMKPKHECPHLDIKFKINDEENFQFWKQQISHINAEDSNGNIVLYEVVGRKTRSPGRVINAKETMRINDHHGYADIRLLRIEGDVATLGYMWNIDHPVRLKGRDMISISSGFIDVPIKVTKNELR